MNYFGSALKYAKSYLIKPTEYPTWISFMLFFKSNDKLVLDKAYIFLGKVPFNYYTHFINFSNWNIIDNQLYYINDEDKKYNVNPENVYLYYRIGSSNYKKDDIINNKLYWYNWVSSPSNNLYRKLIKDINPDDIILIDLNDKRFRQNIIKSVKNVKSPIFKSIRYYGSKLDQGCFSNLNIDLL